MKHYSTKSHVPTKSSVAFLATIALATVIAKEGRLADHVPARWYGFAVRSLDLIDSSNTPEIPFRFQHYLWQRRGFIVCLGHLINMNLEINI
jgi:hypothetical protein